MNARKTSHFPKKVAAIIKRVNFKSGLSFLLDNDELIKIEKTQADHIFGIAVDLGTTSICVSLCNLENKQELAQVIVRNKQYIYAQDIQDFSQTADKLQHNQQSLSRELIYSVNKAIKDCLRKSGVEENRIFTAIVAGNPVMINLLLQTAIKTNLLKKQKNQYQESYLFKAAMLGLNINPQANIRFLPGIDSVIGSDTVSAILKLGMFKTKDQILCIDVGINSKIILGNNKKITVACSKSSSSFEGHLLKCGMIAKPGAIEWVRINKGEIKILTVGHIRPVGISGSGVIDTISELLKNKIINSQGQMKSDSFVVYQDKSSCVELTADDIRKIQVSKAIIFAGIKILMKNLNVGFDQIKKVFICGELGSYLNTEHIVLLGMVPVELKNKINFGGNAAFLGAKMVLLNKKYLNQMNKIQKLIKHIDLKQDQEFLGLYKRALNF
ncbi:MAG: ASKHA domain-containing protein [Candidatus Omnitrophota bacterium]